MLRTLYYPTVGNLSQLGIHKFPINSKDVTKFYVSVVDRKQVLFWTPAFLEWSVNLLSDALHAVNVN